MQKDIQVQTQEKAKQIKVKVGGNADQRDNRR